MALLGVHSTKLSSAIIQSHFFFRTHKYPAVGFAVIFNPFLEHLQIRDSGRTAQMLDQKLTPNFS